jgi:ribonucleotide monophosphatase NagD (HAD superfamily)
MRQAAELRGEDVGKSDVLAIGDAVRTDIAGGTRFGIDALFIGQGIHRAAIAKDGALDATSVAELFSGDAPQAIAAMMTLRW